LVPHFWRKCSPSVIVNHFISFSRNSIKTFQFSTFAGWNIVRWVPTELEPLKLGI
jgi:hypothetical protein